MALEVELKLSIAPDKAGTLARAAPLKAASSGNASTKHVYSVYYDTPQFELREAGVALRLRRVGKQWMQTLKTSGRADGGLHQRQELDTPLPAQIVNYPALSASGVAEVLTDSQLPTRLAPVFTTDFKRTTRILETATGTRIEFCLDRGAISAGTAQAPISEIELELQTGAPAHLIDLALALLEHVPLRLERASKAERGYALAAGTPPTPIKATPVELDPAMSVAQALEAIAFNCIAHLQMNEGGVLESEDIEYIHQARVAVRRLRSAFSIFHPAFPPALLQDLSDDLRWLARTLGEARDWDVMLDETLPGVCEALPGEPELHEVLERCAHLKTSARARVRDAVRSQRYTATLLGLLGFFLRAPWQVSADAGATERERPLAEFAASVLQDRHRKVAKQGEALAALDAEHLHALRIRVKKLRYAAEFFGSLYSKKAVRDYVVALSGLQTLLGTLNDAATAERLTEAMREAKSDTQLEGVGLLRGWCAARAQTDRKKLRKAWSRFEACEVFW